MQSIITKVRNVIEDNASSGSDIFNYVTSNIFTLTRPNASSTGMLVYVNGAAHTSFTFNSSTNKVTITGLTAGDSVEVFYNAYDKYSDTEIKGYIKSALYYLTIFKYREFFVNGNDAIVPTPSFQDEYMIAIVAGILINKNIVRYSTPEITIQFVEKQTKEEKIKDAINTFKKAYGVYDYHAQSEYEEDFGVENE